MKLSTLLAYSTTDFSRGVEQIVAMERAGLDIVWVAEPYGFDAPTTLGYLAARTTTLQLGTGIVPIYSRTPTLTAMTAAGLDWVSGGRAILGLGASGPQVIEGFHGVPYDRPVGRTREVICICRKVWRRERLEHSGRDYQIPLPADQGTGLGKALKLVVEPVRPDIPIFVAALGGNNVSLAAELAQGWLPLFFMPSRARDIWGEALSAGLALRSPELGPLEVCAGGICAVGDDVEHLRDLARPAIALYVGGMGAKGRNFYNDLFVRYGYEKQAQQIQELFLAGKRRDAEAMIPAEFLEDISLCGSRGYVKDRLAVYQEAGVTILNVEPVAGVDPIATIEELRSLL